MDEFIKKLIGRLEEEFPFSIIEGDLISKKDTIEIVNQLAEEYNNDFCEWKEDMTLSRSAIGHGKFESLMYVSKWDYCPYCGKKIKAVE